MSIDFFLFFKCKKVQCFADSTKFLHWRLQNFIFLLSRKIPQDGFMIAQINKLNYLSVNLKILLKPSKNQ